jgi:hypothetical protein
VELTHYERKEVRAKSGKVHYSQLTTQQSDLRSRLLGPIETNDCMTSRVTQEIEVNPKIFKFFNWVYPFTFNKEITPIGNHRRQN